MPQKPPRDDGRAKQLREYLTTTGLKWKESQTSYIFTCPRCQKAEKLWMFKQDGRFICFYCSEIEGFKGKPEFALADMLGLQVGEIRRDLYGEVLPPSQIFFDFEIEDWWSDDEYFEQVPDMETFPDRVWAPDCLPIEHPLASRGRKYLEGRGLSLEVASHYGIRYSGPQTRVLFPVQYKGKLFGWQGRAVGPTEFFDPDTGDKKTIPKVLTTPGLKKDQMVMFADRLVDADQAIISEGPMDAIKCHLCAPEGRTAGNVATMGKGVSGAQINLIKYSGVRRVYLALDPDAAVETERLINEFYGFLDVYIMEPPKPYKDFGEMPMEEVADVYRRTKPAGLGRAYVYLNPDNILFRKRR